MKRMKSNNGRTTLFIFSVITIICGVNALVTGEAYKIVTPPLGISGIQARIYGALLLGLGIYILVVAARMRK